MLLLLPAPHQPVFIRCRRTYEEEEDEEGVDPHDGDDATEIV